MPGCPFCRIPDLRAEEIVARNDYCFLVDNPEGSLQHGMMIIPFRHVETPFELSPIEWQSTYSLVQTAHAMLTEHTPDGFNLGWNVGRAGGQEVNHAHLHVFARFADEPLAGKGIRRWFKSSENRRPG